MLLKNNHNGQIIRVLDTNENGAFVIDCCKLQMPYWIESIDLNSFNEITYEELLEVNQKVITPLDEISPECAAIARQRFSYISPVLNCLKDISTRSKVIRNSAKAQNIAKQTVRKYLSMYLIYQDKAALAPKECIVESTLTEEQKNMRWALNKFFYTSSKNSLPTAYMFRLKEKYCNIYGELNDEYPSFYQFRYFYRKTRNMQNFYISRNGIKDYERNERPLLGDGIQQYSKSVGMGMLDSTVCDIYLVNTEGKLVGRPILTACVDAYSGLCNGYLLSWEGGVYSLRGLMTNILADKVSYCESFGITIEKDMWDSDKLPGIFLTDMGSEYKSENFAQLTELGVTIENLDPYRPDLKGAVEKFFDLIQDSFKPSLKGKGVIEHDFRERGAHDYRKDACLTMEEFEKIIIRCILYYNNYRIVESFPYTEDMIAAGIQPHSSSIWNWGCRQESANLIETTVEKVLQVLLLRAIGKFARNGLIVNKLRYKNKNYNERFISKDNSTVTVAYDPDDVSQVWLIENGAYVKFELIESRFDGESLDSVNEL